MKWNVFSIDTIEALLKPKFVLEPILVKYEEDETYGEHESTRLVFRNKNDMPEINYIKRILTTFIQNTYVYYKDEALEPLRIWQDNLNEGEEHIRYSSNNLVSPPLEVLAGTYILEERHFHKWLLAQGLTEEQLNTATVTLDVDVIYAYDGVNTVVESSEDGEVYGTSSERTAYMRDSEIKRVAQLIKDESLRNRVLTILRSHRRIVTAPEKENRCIKEIIATQK